GARWGYRMGNAEAVDSVLNEGLTCAVCECHMGITAEEVAARYRLARADQDGFAPEAQHRPARAHAQGRLRDGIVPVPVPRRKAAPLRVDADEYPSRETTTEKRGVSRAAFKKDGTVTAGNASGINDGAAALVVTTGKQARSLGRTPLARILAYVSTG